VWRLNNRRGLELPDNIMTGAWLPRNDLPAHPSVKLYITHCGNNAQFEAVNHAVPMIGFPISPINDQLSRLLPLPQSKRSRHDGNSSLSGFTRRPFCGNRLACTTCCRTTRPSQPSLRDCDMPKHPNLC